MKRGQFIAFEGGEGVGKSTQAQLLAEALEARGIAALVTREPGGTAGAEAIRALLLEPSREGWGARAEALLFAAARADHVARLIEPALAEGRWVICDRFVDSSRAYQGGEDGLADGDILALHAIGSADLLPDKVLVLTASAETATHRLAARGGADRIESRDADYHARVAERFRRMAEADPGRYSLIAGDGSPEETHAAILAALVPLMDDPS